MLKIYLAIVVLLQEADALRRFTVSKTLMEEASEAMRDVLEASDIKDRSVTIITDGSSHVTTTFKITKNLEDFSGVSFIDMVTWDQTLDFSSIRVLQGTSKSPFLIIASDSYDYLNSLITALYERNLLVWSTRLLIVTRLPLQVIHHLKEVLSNVNGMVLTKYKNGYTQGWYTYVFIPYSHRALKIARWSQTGFHYLTSYRMFPEKFLRLLDGGHLISTAEVYPPHIMEKENSNEDDRILRNPFRGPGVEILKILSAVINFTTTVIRPPDGAYGVRSSNGTWNGMIGMQKRKEVDFSFAPFNILYARAQVVDYTSPFIIEYGRILARKGEVEANPFGFLLPLAPSVWGFLILSLVVLMAASFFMSFVYSKIDATAPQYPLANLIRVFLGQEPAERSIKEWSMTILVASWVIGMLVLIESYVGNLRSLLIARTVPQPYHSVRAVVDDPRIAVLWVAGVAYQQILQSFTSGVFKELADAGPNGKITYIDSTKFYEMVDTKVSAGTHVLVCEELTLKILVSSHFSNKGSCFFYISKEAFFPLMTAMTVPKYSPLLTTLEKRIIMINEGGLYDHWVERETLNATYCATAPTKILFQSALSLQSLWGMFVIVAFGCVLGSVAFCLELIVFNWTRTMSIS